jgi:hypothetical protein
LCWRSSACRCPARARIRSSTTRAGARVGASFAENAAARRAPSSRCSLRWRSGASSTAPFSSASACLPVRRKALFTSAALAGLLPLLCANLAAFLLAFLAELSIGCAHFGSIAQGFAIASLQLVLFYGFATLCAQLTGNILILPAVYTVLNFVAVVVEMLVRYVLSLFVYGLATTFDTPTLRWFSPVVGIVTGCSVHRLVGRPRSSGLADCQVTGGGAASYAAVGVLLLVARLSLPPPAMESAGDVVAVGCSTILLGMAPLRACFGCLFKSSFSTALIRFRRRSMRSSDMLPRCGWLLHRLVRGGDAMKSLPRHRSRFADGASAVS